MKNQTKASKKDAKKKIKIADLKPRKDPKGGDGLEYIKITMKEVVR